MLTCEIIGNIGQDAEIKNINGKSCVSFNVAHSESRRDANGNKVSYATWVSVLMNGDGGGLFQYLKKGVKVFVRGRLSVKTYQDRNGNWQPAINVSSNEVVLCDLKNNDGSNSNNGDVPF